MKTRKRMQKCKRYAKAFCDFVRSDLIATDSRMKYIITSQNPIVKCYIQKACTKEDIPGAEKTASGKSIITGQYVVKENAIYIFNVLRSKPKDLKQIIRHECIHFLLDKSGLPYKDTDESFICLAAEYDALPYGLLHDENIFNEIMK